jgi:peptide/nickel transport system substrate-binding protein
MTPPQGNNRGFYVHPRLDALTAAGRRTLDVHQRKQIYSEVQKLVAEDLPYIPLWWMTNVVVKDRRVKGFVPYPSGDLFSFTEAWIED